MKLAASDGGFTGSDMQEVAKSTKSGRLLEYSMAQWKEKHIHVLFKHRESSNLLIKKGILNLF